jgi:3-oxoacyl-[acyl-carrier protein] reductase
MTLQTKLNAFKAGADLNDPEGPASLAEQVGRLVQRLDILVANAGIGGASSITDQQLDHFDRMYAVNVRAPFFLVQHLLPLMGNGSSVTVITSLSARAAVGDLSPYAATKGAAETMVRHFASKLGAQSIRVNAARRGRHRDLEFHEDRARTRLRFGASDSEADRDA